MVLIEPVSNPGEAILSMIQLTDVRLRGSFFSTVLLSSVALTQQLPCLCMPLIGVSLFGMDYGPTGIEYWNTEMDYWNTGMDWVGGAGRGGRGGGGGGRAPPLAMRLQYAEHKP